MPDIPKRARGRYVARRQRDERETQRDSDVGQQIVGLDAVEHLCERAPSDQRQTNADRDRRTLHAPRR